MSLPVSLWIVKKKKKTKKTRVFSQKCDCQQINSPQRKTLPQMAASNNCSDSNHKSRFLIPFPFKDNICRCHICFLKISGVFIYDSKWLVTKTTALGSGKTNNLKRHFWDEAFLLFVLFKERKLNMKPIQIVTLLSEMFYLLSDSFIVKFIQKNISMLK